VSIAGEQSQLHNGGMRTDKKIRQRESSFAATFFVSQKYFSCQKKGLFGNIEQNEFGGSQGGFEFSMRSNPIDIPA
jgi:hypothetical protein